MQSSQGMAGEKLQCCWWVEEAYLKEGVPPPGQYYYYTCHCSVIQILLFLKKQQRINVITIAVAEFVGRQMLIAEGAILNYGPLFYEDPDWKKECR